MICLEYPFSFVPKKGKEASPTELCVLFACCNYTQSFTCVLHVCKNVCYENKVFTYICYKFRQSRSFHSTTQSVFIKHSLNYWQPTYPITGTVVKKKVLWTCPFACERSISAPMHVVHKFKRKRRRNAVKEIPFRRVAGKYLLFRFERRDGEAIILKGVNSEDSCQFHVICSHAVLIMRMWHTDLRRWANSKTCRFC